MIANDVRLRPLTARVAQRLRRLSLARGQDVFLGSEKELMATFGVSRPTFRQAVNLVAHEQLVEVVRGTRGGIYSRRPDIGGVIGPATAYLMTRRTTLRDMLEITGSLIDAASLQAISCNDPEMCERAQSLVNQMLCPSRAQTLEQFQDEEFQTISLLGEMAGNPATELFLKTLYAVGIAAFPSIFRDKSELMQRRRIGRARMMEAVLKKDMVSLSHINTSNRIVSEAKIDEALLSQEMVMLWDADI